MNWTEEKNIDTDELTHDSGTYLHWLTDWLTASDCLHTQVTIHIYFCSLNESYLAVRVGEWDTQKEQEPNPHQDIAVERVVIHPRFFAPALFYDVAILFLQVTLT